MGKSSKAKPGTYALVLLSSSALQLQVGRRLEMQVEPGYYIYIGSAFGPGGVQARLSRQQQIGRAKHWHLDYLREHSAPLHALVCYDPVRREHSWAEQLNQLQAFTPTPGFGCSDCHCPSHLFFTADAEAVFNLGRNLVGKIEKWAWKIHAPAELAFEQAIRAANDPGHTVIADSGGKMDPATTDGAKQS